MKATGIIRRIDDLGRVAIPKEIRRTLRIQEGDPLEISVDDKGNICLHKYGVDLNSEIEYLKEKIEFSEILSYRAQKKVMVLLDQVSELIKGEE